MNAKLSRDTNGNKIVRLTFSNARGFSIQTNGNLPETHRTGRPDWSEIRAYVLRYGSLNQQRIMQEEPADKRTLYKTARATIACAYFKVGDYVSVQFNRLDENGMAWYQVSKDNVLSTFYPENHLTNFCL